MQLSARVISGVNFTWKPISSHDKAPPLSSQTYLIVKIIWSIQSYSMIVILSLDYLCAFRYQIVHHVALRIPKLEYLKASVKSTLCVLSLVILICLLSNHDNCFVMSWKTFVQNMVFKTLPYKFVIYWSLTKEWYPTIKI